MGLYIYIILGTYKSKKNKKKCIGFGLDNTFFNYTKIKLYYTYRSKIYLFLHDLILKGNVR
jgi:hypothetical protein